MAVGKNSGTKVYSNGCWTTEWAWQLPDKAVVPATVAQPKQIRGSCCQVSVLCLGKDRIQGCFKDALGQRVVIF